MRKLADVIQVITNLRLFYVLDIVEVITGGVRCGPERFSGLLEL